jgi:hypothetical protein
VVCYLWQGAHQGGYGDIASSGLAFRTQLARLGLLGRILNAKFSARLGWPDQAKCRLPTLGMLKTLGCSIQKTLVVIEVPAANSAPTTNRAQFTTSNVRNAVRYGKVTDAPKMVIRILTRA